MFCVAQMAKNCNNQKVILTIFRLTPYKKKIPRGGATPRNANSWFYMAISLVGRE
jgi:hypothetical protein